MDPLAAVPLAAAVRTVVATVDTVAGRACTLHRSPGGRIGIRTAARAEKPRADAACGYHIILESGDYVAKKAGALATPPSIAGRFGRESVRPLVFQRGDR